MTNQYYTPTGTPQFQTRALSAQQRSEDSLVQAGFDKLPSPSVLGGSGQNYAVDTGMPSNIVVALNPNITVPFDGMELVVKVISAATGPSTIVAGALSVAPIVRYDNSPILANDWLPQQIISLRYNAANSNYQFTPASNGVAVAVVPLLDSSPSFANATDQSKLVKLNLSALTTGTTRNWTVPDRDVVIGNFKDRVVRTSNVLIVKSNNSNLIDITSGTFTQTFDAAATLGNGWHIFLRNSGTGDITLDPNAAELIDGLTSYIMYPGEVRLIQCDGAAFTSLVLHGFKRTWLASGTFVRPPGYLEFGGKLSSAGQSGQRTNNVGLASKGGNAGGTYPFLISSALMGASQTITVGAGGAAVSGVAVGNDGGDSSIGTLIVVKAGTNNGSGAVSGLQVLATGIAVGFEGAIAQTTAHSAVWGGGTCSTDGSSNSGNSVEGGGAGSTVVASGFPNTAGTSLFGGNGGAGSIASNGTAGSQPGGGGGGTQTGTSSGAGGDGKCEMWGLV